MYPGCYLLYKALSVLQVNINDKGTYSFPESWNELNAFQLVAIAPYFFQPEITFKQKSVIACHLCSLDYNSLRHNNEYFCNEINNKIIPRLDFLFDEIGLTAQLLPVIEVKKRFMFFGTRTLAGPAGNFDNITLAEFSDTESCLSCYQSTKDEVWLNRFIAVLYRPKRKGVNVTAADYNGDERQPYNFYLNDFISTMVSSLSLGTKLAIMLWYLGCRHTLVTDYDFLFTGKNKQKAQEGSWTDVIHGLAGPKFGTVEQTMSANLKVVLKELFILHQQAKELTPITETV